MEGRLRVSTLLLERLTTQQLITLQSLGESCKTDQ